MQHRANPVILNSPLTSQTFQNNKLTTSIWCASLWKLFLNWGPIINWAQGIVKVFKPCSDKTNHQCGIRFGRLLWFCLRTIIIPRICIICNTATLHTWKNGSNPSVATLHVPRNETWFRNLAVQESTIHIYLLFDHHTQYSLIWPDQKPGDIEAVANPAIILSSAVPPFWPLIIMDQLRLERLSVVTNPRLRAFSF